MSPCFLLVEFRTLLENLRKSAMKSLVRCTFLRLLINSARIASLIALNSRIVEKVQENTDIIAPFWEREQKVRSRGARVALQGEEL